MTAWTYGDDLIVGLSYIQHGTEVTDQIAADLPEHTNAAIEMRLKNFEWLATQGEKGLANYAESTLAAYNALVPALLFRQAVQNMTDAGWTGHEITTAMKLPDQARGTIVQYSEQQHFRVSAL
jgi:hypothetical protein